MTTNLVNGGVAEGIAGDLCRGASASNGLSRSIAGENHAVDLLPPIPALKE